MKIYCTLPISPYYHHGWNDFFIEILLYLKETYNADIISSDVNPGYVKEFDYDLPDCEMFIYDEEKDILKGITWADRPGSVLVPFKKRSNPEDRIVFFQTANFFPKGFNPLDFTFKLLESSWIPYDPATNYDYFYHLRKFIGYDKLIDEMFFMGNDAWRYDVKRLRDIGICNPTNPSLNHVGYMREMIKYKIGFACPCAGEVAYRDFEYLATGVPMLRLEFMTQLNPPLIPNYHYIAVDRSPFPWSVDSDREGGELYVEAYKKRFLEVKDNIDFLEFIAKNGKEYYEKYSHPSVRLKHLMNILELWT